MLKQLAITIVLVSIISVFTLGQEQPSSDKKECTKGCCSNHSSHNSVKMSYVDADSTHKHRDNKTEHKMHDKYKEMKTEHNHSDSIIRESEIDLKAIDENKDGKVFQDQMCWNVISDKAGECPKCGMKLKDVSLKKAKENLVKHNYKVK
ncbi:heavy metal-binding domain-containing protein [Ignavibacterium sp.]|uniref:heavy metal-binding domain-containing protein n=1 Tax=Ignavibacterium sp. TaxID=2651167 RepID=UPI00307D6CD6